jgi:hypothetical protein
MSSNHHNNLLLFSIGCCDVILGLSCNLGTLAQVGAYPKYVERTLKMYKEILHLGLLLRRPTRESKASWSLQSMSSSNPYGWKDNFTINIWMER